MQISETTRDEAFRLFGRLVARSDPGRLEAWADLGLTMTQLRLLFLLRPADGLSAGAIADQLRVTPSTLTRIMDRLVRHDLVRRETDCNDRRLVRHHLTAGARRIIEEMERFGRARMDRTIVGTSMPRIIADLGGFGLYSWVGTGFLLASTATVPVVGKLTDIYGRKPFYMAGIFILILGSALCGSSQNVEQLIAFRVI